MHVLQYVQPRDAKQLPQLWWRTAAPPCASVPRVNYRHAYHAGNFADVHKHTALVAIVSHLRRKGAPFCVIDTHAGRGLYDLSGAEATRTGEAAQGARRLAEYQATAEPVVRYLEIVRGFLPRFYPGSPLIAAKLLRESDRLVAVETQPDEFTALRACLTGFPDVCAILGDGYARLPALLPPPERRGLILIDPPYEAHNEAELIPQALTAAICRFATGIFLVWYPLKPALMADAFAGEIRSRSAAKLLSLTLDVGRNEKESSGRLTASSLLVINPPYGLDAEMEAAQSELVLRLRQGPSANARVTWLAGP